jgi:hypothetical protein
MEIQMIKAEVHDDNHQNKVNFDATPWFVGATDEEIQDLAECDWGGDYPADAVAEMIANVDPKVNNVLEFKSHDVGFECHVDGDSAIEWIKNNRPHLLEDGEVKPKAPKTKPKTKRVCVMVSVYANVPVEIDHLGIDVAGKIFLQLTDGDDPESDAVEATSYEVESIEVVE